MECVLHLEKSVNQSLLELHRLVTDRNDPHLCDFIGTHYLNEQEKSNKELGDHATNLCKTGVPWVWHGRVSLWQAHTGKLWWELSLRLTSHSYRDDFPGYQGSGSVFGLCSLSSFLSTIPSSKVIWYATLPSHPKRKKKCEKKIWEVCVPSRFSHVWPFVILWTVGCQAPLSRQE